RRVFVHRKDKADNRILRLRLTDNSRSFWEKRLKQDEAFIRGLFTGLDDGDIAALWKGFHRMYANALKAGEGIHEDD
uniref:hypothetical protein n=1 Tax=Gorillibacterium massiliense TaxID=1280390 RepID=UPI000593C11F